MPRTAEQAQLERTGRHWLVRYPPEHYPHLDEGWNALLFDHRTQATKAMSLEPEQAAERLPWVGIGAGRLVRARHLEKRCGVSRLFFVVGGKRVAASHSLATAGWIFSDRTGQFYLPGYPRCLDCGGGLLARGRRGTWVDAEELEMRLRIVVGHVQDFADGLRLCSGCGSRFADTRYLEAWPLKEYWLPLRRSTRVELGKAMCLLAFAGLWLPGVLVGWESGWAAPLGLTWWLVWFCIGIHWVEDVGFVGFEKRSAPRAVLDAAVRAAADHDRSQTKAPVARSCALRARGEG